MIYTQSVLRGYDASKGFIVISLAFFIGTLTVKIPSKEQLELYSLVGMDYLFGLQLFIHLLMTVQVIISINLDKWEFMDALSKTLGRIAVLSMIVVYMWQWQTFLKLINE